MYVLKGKFPFIHRLEGETRTSLNNPGALLSDWFSIDGYQTSTAGISITGETALKHAAYWRAINLLSSQIANFPLSLYRRQSNGDTTEITDHPAVRLLTLTPNDAFDHFIFRETMQANVLTWGNGYAFIHRLRNGEPAALEILASRDVTPKSNGLRIVYDYKDKTHDTSSLLHIRGIGFDGIRGKAPIQVAAESIGSGLAMQKYTNDFFKNGAKQSGVLMHPLSLSPDTIGKMRKSFEGKMKDKDGGTMILDEGMKYQPLSIPPDQQQLLESKQFSVQDMARWFGIPPFLLFEESRSTFTNISDQGMSFVRYTLNQWVGRWEAELSRKLLTEEERKDHYFKFNMDALMRGNAKDRFESYRAGLDLGVYSINEVRRLEELNSIDGGDIHLVQVNRTKLNDIGNGKGNAVPPGGSEGIPE